MCLAKFKIRKEEKKARKTILTYDNGTLDSIVKIQGTQYDRKRKLTERQVAEIVDELGEGIPVEALAQKYNVSEWIIRYNTDPAFRAHQLKLREKKSKAHINVMDFEDRVAYKRNLIKSKKIEVRGLI